MKKQYIYQRVRDLREDHDLTQKQVAEILKEHNTTYIRWETGETEIPIHILKKLAVLYKTSIDKLTEIEIIKEVK